MAMREVVKNYMGDDTESPKANPDEDFSINKLALNIVNDRVMREQGKNAMDNQSFKADQLKVAELFSQIQKQVILPSLLLHLSLQLLMQLVLLLVIYILNR